MTKNQGCNLFQSVKRAFVRKKSDKIRDVEPYSEREKERRPRDGAKEGQQRSQQRSDVSRKADNASMRPDIDPATIDLDSVSPARTVDTRMMLDRANVRHRNRRAPSSITFNKMQESVGPLAEGFKAHVEVHHQPRDGSSKTMDTTENLKPESRRSARQPPTAAPRKTLTEKLSAAERDPGPSVSRDSENKRNSKGEPLQEHSNKEARNSVEEREERVKQSEIHTSSQRIETSANKRDSQNLERVKKAEAFDQRGSQNLDKIKNGEEMEKRGSHNLDKITKMEENNKRGSQNKDMRKSGDNKMQDISKSDIDLVKKSARDTIGKGDSKRDLRGARKSDDEFNGISSEEFIRNAQRSASEKKLATKSPDAHSRRSKTAEDIVESRNFAPTQIISADKQAPVKSSRKATSMKKKRESGDKSSDENERNRISMSAQNLASTVSMQPDQDASRDSGNIEIAKDKKSRPILRWGSKSKSRDKVVSKSPEPSSPDDETRGLITRSDSARVARLIKGRSLSPHHDERYNETSHSAPNSLKKNKKESKSVKGKREKDDSRLENAALIVSSENDKKKDKGKKKEDKKSYKAKEETDKAIAKGASSKSSEEKNKTKNERENSRGRDESRNRDSREGNKRNSGKQFYDDDNYPGSSKSHDLRMKDEKIRDEKNRDERIKDEKRNSSNEELDRSKRSDQKALLAEKVSFDKSAIEMSEKKVTVCSDDDLIESNDTSKHLRGSPKKTSINEPVYAISGKITKSMAKKINFGQQNLDSTNVDTHITAVEALGEVEHEYSKVTKRSISAVEEKKEEKGLEDSATHDREQVKEMDKSRDQFKKSELVTEKENKQKEIDIVIVPSVSFKENEESNNEIASGVESITKNTVQDVKSKIETETSGIMAGNTGFHVLKSIANESRPSSRDMNSSVNDKNAEKGKPSVDELKHTVADKKVDFEEKIIKSSDHVLEAKKAIESTVITEENKLPPAKLDLEAPQLKSMDEKPAEAGVAPWANAAKRQSVRINWNDIGKKSNEKQTDVQEGNELSQIFKKRSTDPVSIADVIGNDKPTSPPNGKKSQPLAPLKTLPPLKLSSPTPAGDGQISPGVMFKDTALSPSHSLTRKLTTVGQVSNVDEDKKIEKKDSNKNSSWAASDKKESDSKLDKGPSWLTSDKKEGDSKVEKVSSWANSDKKEAELKVDKIPPRVSSDKKDGDLKIAAQNEQPKSKPELFAAKGFRQPAAALKPIKAPSRAGDDWVTKAKERQLENDSKGKMGGGEPAENSEDVSKSAAAISLKSVGIVSASNSKSSEPVAGDEGEMETVQERMRRLMASSAK